MTPEATARARELVRELLPLIGNDHPDSTAALTTLLQRLAPVRPGPGFACLRWYGTLYTFTALQARLVEILHTAWENGTPDVRQEYLLTAVVSDSARLVDLFKDHPAWNVLIVPGGLRGTFRLADQAASET